MASNWTTEARILEISLRWSILNVIRALKTNENNDTCSRTRQVGLPRANVCTLRSGVSNGCIVLTKHKPISLPYDTGHADVWSKWVCVYYKVTCLCIPLCRSIFNLQQCNMIISNERKSFPQISIMFEPVLWLHVHNNACIVNPYIYFTAYYKNILSNGW
mgnify:CR=1 FL=1